MNAINWLTILLYFFAVLIMPHHSPVLQKGKQKASQKNVPKLKEIEATEPKDSFASVAADKMNVFYAGVDNPVSIAVEGVPAGQITAFTEGPINIQPASKPGKFNVHVTGSGHEAWVIANVGDSIYKKRFRLKEIPLPVAKLGSGRHGVYSAGHFNACQGIIPVIENFDFEAKCTIHSYRLIRFSKNNDPQVASGVGNWFSGNVRNLINLSKIGDFYSFMDIRAMCPGWKGSKELNSIGVEIK